MIWLSMEEGIQVLWTKKNTLNRIIDPLSLSDLKFLENEYLVGITTQTDRLRYFSFLAWAWNNVKKSKLSNRMLLPIEKVFSLVCAKHHFHDKNYPRGIRNRQSAEKFLEDNEEINLDEFTSFGRKNKVGYGNYYYHGPLKDLNICWEDKNNNLIFSDVGEKIADIYERTVNCNATISVGYIFT